MEIYEEYNILQRCYLINNKIIKLEKIHLCNEFVNMKLRDVFQAYSTSKQFTKELVYVKGKEDEKFAILYEFISRIFVDYYTYSKGNKPRSFERIMFRNSNVKIFKIIKVEDSNDDVYWINYK
jgi:hypothetical protein